MSGEFGPAYAASYDQLYAEKPYEQECDLLEAVFRRFAATPVHSVLDLGCGTGGHALPLARRGYHVIGVDRSPDMLALARAKLAREPRPLDLELAHGDLRTVALGSTVDAAVMMFAVLGYQLGNDDASAALATVRRHLRPGGLLAFDVWYGPAVLGERPSERLRVIPTEDGQLLRASSGELDVARHRCSVRFHVWRIAGGRLVEETEETHTMRFFFPLELAALLSGAGMRLEHLSAFPTLDQPPDERTWNVLGVARAL